MASTESCVTIHMVASLDGFIARNVRRVRARGHPGPGVRPGVPQDDRVLRDGLAHLRDRIGLRIQGIRLVVWRQADIRPDPSRVAQDQGYDRVLRWRSRVPGA